MVCSYANAGRVADFVDKIGGVPPYFDIDSLESGGCVKLVHGEEEETFCGTAYRDALYHPVRALLARWGSFVSIHLPVHA